LADVTGMRADALRSSLQAYNAAARGDAPDAFGKSTGSCQVLDQGPFYACDISVGNKAFPLGALTLGGLKVNEDTGALLDGNGGRSRACMPPGAPPSAFLHICTSVACHWPTACFPGVVPGRPWPPP
ncbi:MAG: hypothetical protein RSC66_09750, partial [Comamonas sp.]